MFAMIHNYPILVVIFNAIKFVSIPNNRHVKFGIF